MKSVGGSAPSVIHVVPYYPPDRVGGVGEHVRVIHEGHIAAGFDSQILTSGASRDDPLVHRVASTPTRFFLTSWKGLRLARRCDVVHIHHGEGVLLALLLRLSRGRPYILLMFHVDVRKREISDRSHIFEGTTFGATGLKLAKRRLMGVLKSMVERLAWVLADSAVVETRAVQREIADLRPKREVRVIAHGLGESPSYENEEPSHVELLFVGTPGVRKRTHLLPAILERVREEVEGARLRVVGFTLDDDPGLKAEANRRGVTDSIEFVGRVRSEDVVPYYRAADVLLLPSAYEGLPMVLLEAMREGLVPVATDVSGHPDAINDDQNGILVPLDDVTGFGEKAARLLMDPVSRAASGRFSQETIRADFSLARELGEYLQLYEECSGRPGRRR